MKYWRVLKTGFGAALPRPHNEAVCIVSARFSRSSKSCRVPLPSVILVNISNNLVVPIRQGVHLPQDSSTVNSRKNLAISTIQSDSSRTSIPPEPIIEPIELNEPKSIGVSKCSVGIHPPDGPPVWTALNFLPSGIPPPISNTISLKVVPIGTSTSPTFSTFPPRAKTLVPLESSVPKLANQSPPLSIIAGMLAKVSTLFKQVGDFHRPLLEEL